MMYLNLLLTVQNNLPSGIDVDASVLPGPCNAREGIQRFEDPAPENSFDTVGCALSHASSHDHVNGKAIYVNDMPPFNSE